MNLFKKILTLLLITTILTVSLTCCSLKAISSTSNIAMDDSDASNTVPYPVKAGVLFFNLNDPYSTQFKKSFEDIQKENNDRINFTFIDGKNNSDIQKQIIDDLIQKHFNLLLLNLQQKQNSIIDEIIYKAKQRSIPVILFNTSIDNLDAIKDYKKSLIINSDVAQSGVLQGNLLVNEWNSNKKIIDKNADNKLQYVILQGNPNSIATTLRTKYSIATINDAGILTEELASVVCYWDKDLAKKAIDTLFFRYANRIEAIIANNDAMAIGAVESLQKYGYNTGNKFKTIPVVGIDAIPEAQDLIKKDFMLGSVSQDSLAIAEAIFNVGMNLVSGKPPLDGTTYQFDKTGVRILIPNKEYIKEPTTQR